MKEDQIKEILIRGNYVSPKDIQKSSEIAKKRNVSFVDYLISNNVITRDILGQAIAEFYRVPYADLNSIKPSRDQILRIPESIAKKFRVALFREEPKKVIIATDDPIQINLVGELNKLFPSKKVLIYYATTEDIDDVFIYYRGALGDRLKRTVDEGISVVPNIVGEILEDALVYRASDVHFEPQEKEVVIRFRIDGVLGERGKISRGLYENILNRVKVLAHLRIDEHFSTQDGAIRYVSKKGRGAVDMRVSVAPILDGEKIVIRLLSKYTQSLSFSDLGMSESYQDIVLKASQKPFGMILVTGPTGSGKTTTLYSILKILNKPDVNITTIEDPVEYRVAGVNQIQVNAQKEITFARGLRSIIRQDPDIILVGEIRDDETAEIAVNAALTGHLMLSTFHANDSATSIPRLLDMGIEPFLLASTLEVVFAQRLVRKICENCRHSQSYSDAQLNEKFSGLSKFFSGKKVTLYQGKGCEACGYTGYKGRTAIFEFIDITPAMKDLILKNPSSGEIWDLAKKQGSVSLFKDGLNKVNSGITTIDEVIRVSEPSE